MARQWSPEDEDSLKKEWNERYSETIGEFDWRFGIKVDKTSDAVKQKRRAMGLTSRRNISRGDDEL